MKSKYLDWHWWFAWHPVQLNTGIWVWLESIQRLKVGCYIYYRDYG